MLGATAHFDAEAYFGSVIVAMFRTGEAANMKRFLAAYLDETDPEPDTAKRAARQAQFAAAWEKQAQKIIAAMAADPVGAKDKGDVEWGAEMNPLPPESVQLTGRMLAGDVNLAELSVSMLHLFHNMRAALHVPDKPPEKLPCGIEAGAQ